MEDSYTSAQFLNGFLHEALREIAAVEQMGPKELAAWEAMDRKGRVLNFSAVCPEAARVIEQVSFRFPVEIWDQDADRPTTGVPGTDVDAALQRTSQLQRVTRVLTKLIDITSVLDNRRVEVPRHMTREIGPGHMSHARHPEARQLQEEVLHRMRVMRHTVHEDLLGGRQANVSRHEVSELKRLVGMLAELLPGGCWEGGKRYLDYMGLTYGASHIRLREEHVMMLGKAIIQASPSAHRLTSLEDVHSLGLKLRDGDINGAIFNRHLADDREVGRLAGIMLEALRNPFAHEWRVVISDATSMHTAHVVKGILNSLTSYMGVSEEEVPRFTIFPLFETEADIRGGIAYLQEMKGLLAIHPEALTATQQQRLQDFQRLKGDGAQVMLSASDSTKRLGLLKSATVNLQFMDIAQSLDLQVFVGLGDSFRRLGLSSPAVLSRLSPLAALANLRTVQPGSQPDVLQNHTVALHRAVIERWRPREPIDTTVGAALSILEERCVAPYKYSADYLAGLSLIGTSRDRQLAFSRKAKKSLAEETESDELSQDQIDAKVDGFRAIEKAMYEMQIRTGDPTLHGLCKAVELWDVLKQDSEVVAKYLSSPEGLQGAPTMSVSVEAQVILQQLDDPKERAMLAAALKHPGKDDATNTVAGLLQEGAAKEDLHGEITRDDINLTLSRLGYFAAEEPFSAAHMVANKFGGAALATVRPV